MLGNTDIQADLAIEPGQHPFIGRTNAYIGDLFQPYRIPVDGGHHNVAELIHRLQIGGRDHRKLAQRRLDTPGGYQHVLVAQCRFNILHDQTVTRQFVAVEVDAHGRQPLAKNTNLGSPRQHGKTRFDITIDVIGHLNGRQGTGLHPDVDNGC